MHHKDTGIYRTKQDEEKEKKKRKPSKMSYFEPMKLSKEDMQKLKEHSKKHSKKHIKNMKKFMLQGKSFSVAHREAMKLDKKSKK